ncbi:protein of unknown function [Tepidibacter aestuarii]|nr:protein of unknown function [Tepidibacter aestuarii]
MLNQIQSLNLENIMGKYTFWLKIYIIPKEINVEKCRYKKMKKDK